MILNMFHDLPVLHLRFPLPPSLPPAREHRRYAIKPLCFVVVSTGLYEEDQTSAYCQRAS